ncbi:hypothetical protein F9288_11230 [Sphingomonas sp. CL5.1]|uniref:hypothetical protein n=1 Tax=Sphingomonas sp. CL5.1 TaxID=2653203 RepID=UPI00158228E6|nr:hypothetical protein [Sphingomonas sp. CL5.1]QKS00137.1 hypothetical protein F9288_11230 [Sphingomonas sp. CL5.1]
MGIFREIAIALGAAGIDPMIGPGLSLCRGWDYWTPKQSATDGKGIARTAHSIILGQTHLPKGGLYVLAPTMSVPQLIGGIWRQCLIRPNDPDADSRMDAFAVSIELDHSLRSQNLVAIIGHSPRDLGLYYDHLRATDPTLFTLVLAKAFKAALQHRASALHDPWPDGVARRWKGMEGDYLPPFLVAVLYAELGRLAMNQAGLIEMSVDGESLTNKQFLDRVPLAGTPHAPAAIRRALQFAPFQSVALGAPYLALMDDKGNIDPATAATWSRTAGATIALLHGLHGDIDITPSDATGGNSLASAYAANPAFWKIERNGKGVSHQSLDAVGFWGLGWRRNAAVRLLEIATTAREWNRQYRSLGPDLSCLPRHQLAKSMAIIGYAWVAEQDAAMALRMIGSVLSREEKATIGFDRWIPAAADPLAIDDYLGAKSGDDMLARAEKILPQLPRPGAFGYTARSQAHLWLNDKGDDIAHYRKLQDDALAAHAVAADGALPSALQDTSRVPANLLPLLAAQHGIDPGHGKIGHNRSPAPEMTDDPKAARGAQFMGQRISPLSTDSMIAKNHWR